MQVVINCRDREAAFDCPQILLHKANDINDKCIWRSNLAVHSLERNYTTERYMGEDYQDLFLPLKCFLLLICTETPFGTAGLPSSLTIF